MLLSIFSSRLQGLMEDEKISKRHLSIKAGVERKSITAYLRGECLPRYDHLTRIADFFEVSADYLLGIKNDSSQCYASTCKIEEIPQLFVARLKESMQTEGFSQGKLAKAINMQQASVSKWIRMKTMPETAIFVELAKIFRCSVDYFIGREPKADDFVFSV